MGLSWLWGTPASIFRTPLSGARRASLKRGSFLKTPGNQAFPSPWLCLQPVSPSAEGSQNKLQAFAFCPWGLPQFFLSGLGHLQEAPLWAGEDQSSSSCAGQVSGWRRRLKFFWTPMS